MKTFEINEPFAIPTVTAIIPCAGFGTRVVHILGEDKYKENTITPEGTPVLWQHLDLAHSYVGVKDVVIIINSKKDETLACILDWAHNRLDSFNEQVRHDLTDAKWMERSNEYARKKAQLSRLPRKHPRTHVNNGFVIPLPEIYSDRTMYIASIGTDHFDAITQNPKDTIKYLVEKVPLFMNMICDPSRDVLVTLPDMFYTNFDNVLQEIMFGDNIGRESKLCAIDPKVFHTADPMQYGRVELHEGVITKVVTVRDTEYVPNDNTYSEVGLLYGKSEIMLDDKEWFYDSMIAHGEIRPLIIESDVIDYGNPANHLPDADDDEDIRDSEEELEDEEELE